MSSPTVVVINDLDDIGTIERTIVRMALDADGTFHVVSLGDVDSLVADEATPSRLRLMLLLAKLADRLIPVTGEVVAGTDVTDVLRAIARHLPERVVVASRDRFVDRVLHRDMLSRLRHGLQSLRVDVIPLAA